MRGQDWRTPNIVYILADDLGWGDLRCYNASSHIPTPHADRLASQGVRFTDMHSPSSVCTPTRYGILTGRYSWRTRLKQGVLWGYSPSLIEPGRSTVASLLKRCGYHTAGVGKWHLGLGSSEKTDYAQALKPGPLDFGFDSYFGIPASLDMEPYLYFEGDRAVQQPTASTPGSTEPRGVFWRGGPRAPGFDISRVLQVLGERAVRTIAERARVPAQPFFLYLPLTAPHTPWLPEAAYRGQSSAGRYGDFVAQVDAVVGAVLRALDRAGAADNTLVILTSDNGADWKEEDKARFAHRANAGWRGEKADIFEGGHRVPFIARWPGRISPRTVTNQLGCLTDLFATVADIEGVKLARDEAEDSYSLVPALLGKGAGARQAIVHHSSDGMFAIREGDWKLILGLGSGGFTKPQRIAQRPGGPDGQLFNLREDPEERQDRYNSQPEIVSRLEGLLERYQREGRSRPV